MRFKNIIAAAFLTAASITGSMSISQVNILAEEGQAEDRTEEQAQDQTENQTQDQNGGQTTGDDPTDNKTDDQTDADEKPAVSVKAANIKTVKIKIEGKQIEIPAKGCQWIKLKGHFHFIQDGKLVKGWKKLTKAEGEKTTHWSFFDKENGRLYTGWKTMGAAEGEKKHISYFGENGWLRTGWQKMGTTANPDGKSKVHWSYFGDNGWLRTGWQKMGTASNPDGKNKVHWSYFGDNGWMLKGWYSNSEGLHYFDSNGWMRESSTAKIEKSEYKFNARGIVTGVNHSDFKYVNQYKTYGYYPMSCGSSSSLMAMQGAGYCKNIDTKREYEDYLSSWRSVCGITFGRKNGVGAVFPSKIVNAIKRENTSKGVPVKGVTKGAVTAEYLKNSINHGQTSVVIVKNFNVFTHWIAITGWEIRDGELVFKIADPLPNDCGRGAGSKATRVNQGNLGTTMKKSTLFTLMDAHIVTIYHGGRSGVTFGDYKELKSYY